MPFPKVFGIPDDIPHKKLRQIRAQIIDALADAMSIPADTIRPLFIQDLIGDPDEGQDSTIYCELDTGLFYGIPDAKNLRARATSAVAQVIWDAFNREYEVEVFIGDLDPEGKTHWMPEKITGPDDLF